jgi:catechol 2,3-dioxygenase-like lactoylglutathione lyase family enzyme
MSGPIDATLRKFHISLNVSSLDGAIAFYRALFGTEPAKVRSDYAKFDLAEPPLVLSLAPGRPAAGGHLNHAGLRVRTAEELVEIQKRLEAAGISTRREDGVACCYAKQTKFWVADPDRALWEVYVFHEDIDEFGDDHGPHAEANGAATETTPFGAVPAAATRHVWAHRLTDPVPPRIPHEDNSLHEVRLEGSINASPDAPHRAGLFADALRALRPGAEIHVHGLAGDRPCARRDLALPGPASAVQHVPGSADVAAELVRAGFADVRFETLSETAYFTVDDVPMREVRLTARKPGHRPAAARHRAVYLGPFDRVTDDFGNVFRRGEPTLINVHDWQVLSKSAARDAFLLLGPDATSADAPAAKATGSSCGTDRTGSCSSPDPARDRSSTHPVA